MHAKNEVFFNKTQVNNRDMSIAVLRTFLSRWKQEYEALLSKRNRSAPRVFEKNVSLSDVEDKPNDSDMNIEKSNEQGLEEKSKEDPCTTSEEPVKIEGKVRGELKPTGVLEVIMLALSASGLRALRYAQKVKGIGQVVTLDNDKGGVEACQRNIKFNGSVACSKVESHLTDACVYMLTHPKEFDVVDFDPYGSPSVSLDSAVQSVDGGILMCTATDMAVLCGGNGESLANQYKRYIVPVLSVQMDFYVRVFVRVYSSASAMKNTPLKLSYVYQCPGCDSFHLQPIGRTVSKELPDVPLFFSLHHLCAKLKCASPSEVIFRSAVINVGYRISGTHVNPLGLKSDAPMDVIWDIMCCWIKNHPVKAQPADQPGSVVLAKEPVLQANFARAIASLSQAQAKKVARFLPNPRRNWGPKLRAGRQITSKHISLLGEEAVIGCLNDQNSEHDAKRKKTEKSNDAIAES